VSGLQLYSPLWLLALVPVGLALILHRRRIRPREVILFGDTSILAQLRPTLAERLAPLVPLLQLAGLLLLVLVLCRPRYGRSEHHRETEGIAIQMALDVSGSMRAMDFQVDGEPVSRLEVARACFAGFVGGSEEGGGDLAGRPDDLIGLIAFGGYADSKVPLTLDHDALLAVAESLEVPEPILDPRGQPVNEEELKTAIGDALALAVERTKDAPTKSKVIILLTDGENTAGIIDPRDATELARTLGIRVYTIGVGSTGLAPFPVQDRFGGTVLRPQHVRLDEDLLRHIASETGGVYRNVQDTNALHAVYAEIDELERTRLQGLTEVVYEERFAWFLWPALLLLVLHQVLVATRFREIP
jgi:Ca-activated chloride channel family protein